MKCSSCGFENKSGAKFCAECDSKLSLKCPSCGSDVEPGEKFCTECGHDLTGSSDPTPKELSFEEKLDKIRKYLPKDLTEKILSQRGKIEGERKQVTVMFCDMEGFTPLVESIGAEEAYAIMDKVYEILIHKVRDYDGTINEMTGDGVMALFGAPIALEDAPQRSIRAAYNIHLEMSRFNEQMKQERKDVPTLRMRIGIHTGPVVVGTLGNDLRVEFKAVGDTVNLASRMETLAEPGATYVTEETHKLTEGLFRLESLGEKEIKGKEEPVRTYRVIGPSTRRTRFDVSAERGLTPFVGRERELEIFLDGFERVKSGRGQAISIVADAGVGKSRLNYEFIKTIDNEDVTILEGKCLSYSGGIAYHPVADLLKANFNIMETDGDPEIREKVEKGITGLGIEEDKNLPYLLDLLYVDESGLDKLPLSPEAKKYNLFEAIKRIVIKGSEIRPLIISIEDLHWVDNSSEEIFKDLLDSIAGARVFLILTYRTEYVHIWGGKSYHSQIHLNRFSNRESHSMLAFLLGTGDIDPDLEQLILGKTEGIPFFIEEFVRSLKDLNYIEQKRGTHRLSKDTESLTIPSTIHDVIMARVDALPQGVKEVLQAGSAIEREFSHELISRVTGLPERELLSHLSALKDSELIYERGVFPGSVYVFKHALTREVVYDSILERGKKTLHGKIAGALEEISKNELFENPGILVDHFIIGEDYQKGNEYAGLAAKKYLRSGSLVNAAEYYKKSAACLERLPRTRDIDIELIDVRCQLARYYSMLNYFDDVKEAIDPVIKLAEGLNYKPGLSRIYENLGLWFMFVESELDSALDYFEKAINLASETGKDEIIWDAYYWYGLCLAYDCQFEKAIDTFDHIAKMPGINTRLKANSIAAYSHLAYCCSGKVDLGYQKCKEVVRLAEDSDDMSLKSWVYGNYGYNCFFKGFFEEAIPYLLEGLSYDEQMNSFVMAAIKPHYLGEIFFQKGEYEQSLFYFNKSSEYRERLPSDPYWSLFTYLGIALSKALMNERDIDIETLLKKLNERVHPIDRGKFQKWFGELLLNLDKSRRSEAEEWIKKAIETDTRNGTRFNLGMDYALYAQFYKKQNNLPQAREQLTKAIDIMKECGADGWVERYERELAVL